jgi:zinc protease
MRALFVASLLAASTSLAATQAPSAPATPGAFPYPMVESRLDNGLRLVVIPTESRGMIALYELVGTGSRDEVEAGHSGFAHFFEHMMFRGTKKWPSDARTALLGSLGVDEGGYTTDDFTNYNMQGPKEALPKLIELEGDRFQNLEFSDDDFKTESRAVLGEYNKNYSNPEEKAYEVLSDLAFDKHTYKHTTMGFLADIQKMPEMAQYARGFFKRFYTPDNVILFVVGDVDPAQVQALVKQHFGAWKGKRQKTDVADEAPLSKERRTRVAWDNPTLDRLMVAWRVPSGVREPRAGALSLLLKGYLFSESSPLTKQLVLEEQLSENVSAWYDIHKDAALFPVAARVKEGKAADAVLARVQAALDDLASGKVDEKRFDAVRSNLRYSLLMNLTSSDSIAGTVSYYAGPFVDPHAIDIVLGNVATSTIADLVAFVKQYFGADRRAVVTLQYAPVVKADAKDSKGGAK